MGFKPEEESFSSKVEGLKVMDQYLHDRTTLGGTRITEADKMMFDSIFATYKGMTFAEKERFLHVSRWFAFLQAQDEVRGNRPKLLFSKNRLY